MSLEQLSDEIILKCLYPHNIKGLCMVNSRFKMIASSVTCWYINDDDDLELMINLNITKASILILPEYILLCNLDALKLISVKHLIVHMCSVAYAQWIRHEYIVIRCLLLRLSLNQHLIIASLNSIISIHGLFRIDSQNHLWLKKRTINTYFITSNGLTTVTNASTLELILLQPPFTIHLDDQDITEISTKSWSEYQGIDVNNLSLYIISMKLKQCMVIITDNILTTQARCIYLRANSPHRCLYAEIVYVDRLEFISNIILPNMVTLYIGNFRFLTIEDVYDIRIRYPTLETVKSKLHLRHLSTLIS